ncbi:hypothetical protein NHP200010_15780 [Helicobacter bizzozeronii]|uniref:hypothetical protein n=1 Tax=Helicobacter bizzozeronii TaxID=56877 RepID=UPI00244D8AD9|nr:hypothetical protein [Helicobacter bizzozeronii]GMB93845.1 hypothetical protein NHP200010_15780 [Helicobacter bizzozeronii]
MLDFQSIEDIGKYYDELQKIKTAMKKAGLLEQHQRALEIEKAFELMLATTKSKKPDEPKRPVGRPRKESTELTQPLAFIQSQEQPKPAPAKPKPPKSNQPKSKGNKKGKGDDKPESLGNP